MFHDCMCGNTVLERLMGNGEVGGEEKKKEKKVVKKRKEMRHVHSGVVIIEAHRDSTCSMDCVKGRRYDALLSACVYVS